MVPPDHSSREHGITRKGHRKTVALLLVLLSLQTLGLKIMYLPLNRVIQLRYCQDYYRIHDPSVIQPDGDISEDLCRQDSVQQNLAWLFGMIETLHLVIDLLVTLPFGVLSDKGCRRLVLVLNYIGFIGMYSWILAVGYFGDIFPARLMLLGPILSLIGGGECVFMSTISAIITDVAPNEIERTTVFAYISSVSYVMHFVSPTLASVTMSWSLWLPFLIGLLLLAAAIPLVSFLPAQPKSISPKERQNEDAEPLLADDTSNAENQGFESHQLVSRPGARGIVKQFWAQISGRANFQLLLGLFLVAALASSNSPLLPQYISKRYDWTFQNAGYLLSIKAVINITLLAVIVPNVVKVMSRRYDFQAGQINQIGAQVMMVISIAGVIFIAISPSVPYLIFSFFVYAMGSALPVFTLSLVKDPKIAGDVSETNALDYSIVMIAKYAGNVIGLPLMTVVWAKGIGTGGAALGSPYFLSAAFYGIGLLLARALRLNG